MRIPQPLIPKEHGAWAVLFVPMLVGSSIAGKCTMSLLFLAVSALGIFMSYVPVTTLLYHLFVQEQPRPKLKQAAFWTIVYLLTGALSMVPLLMKGFWLLPALGVPGLIAFFGNFVLTRYYPKTMASDLLAVCGLTLSAPSGYYVTSGSLDGTSFLLWFLNILFFGCGVFYVHMKIRASAIKKSELAISDKLSVGKLNLLYHCIVLGVVVTMTITHYTPQFVFLAFIPMAIHAVYGTYRLSNRVRFKSLGLLVLGQSIVFGVLLGMIL